MIFTPTDTVPGRSIRQHVGYVAADAVRGVNAIRDLAANLSDTFGGRSGALEREIATARDAALADLRETCSRLRADAVVGLRAETQLVRDGGATMLLVTVSGAAVRLLPDELAARLAAEQAERDAAAWNVEIDGRLRGPFSCVQLGELVQSGRLAGMAEAMSDAGERRAVADLIAGRQAWRDLPNRE